MPRSRMRTPRITHKPRTDLVTEAQVAELTSDFVTQEQLGELTPESIGAYPDTNPDAFINVVEAAAAAPVQVVHHGDDETVERPNSTIVYWLGSVDPINKQVGDFWLFTNYYDDSEEEGEEEE